MAENLTFINSHLIGISFIQSEENSHLRSQWDLRFREENADWIQISGPDQKISEVIKKIVSLRSLQGQNLAGLKIVLAGFYDLSAENVDEQAEFLERLARELQLAHGIMQPMMQFGYVGENPSPNAEALRKHATMVADKKVGKLCLVGRSVTMESALCWKPELLLLDIMRRSQNVQSLLPLPNRQNAVGYLRYAQYSQSQLDKTNAEIARLEQCLGEDGQDSFRAGLRELVDEIAIKAQEDFKVDGSKQPLHPDMSVNPNKFSLTGKYRKMFENAQRETVNAVQATGSRLVAQMKERYIPSAQQAEEMVRQVIAERKPGYAMLQNLKPGQLNLSVEGSLNSSVVSLPYSAAGYTGMIDQYLSCRRDDGVLLCQQAKLEKLLEALERVRPEYAGDMEAMKAELKKQKDLRKRMRSSGEFLQDVTTTGFLLGGCFTSTGNYVGDSRKWLLWRDNADRDQVMNAAPMEQCFIDHAQGQLKNVDEYNLKMLEIYFAEASSAVPQDLIREDC